MPAVWPDVAVIHVHQTDIYGNCQIRGISVADLELARAAKRLIITAERLVDNLTIRMRPTQTLIPYYLVDGVIEVPYGSYPGNMPYLYYSDENDLADWLRVEKDPESPNLVILFEAGGLAPMLPRMPISVGDSRTFFRGLMAAGMTEMMTTCCRGLVDYAFLGGAQIDMYGNINSTVIGDYYKPTLRFPGSGGANDFASFCWKTLVMTVHSKSRFVEKVAFLTSPGYLTGTGAMSIRGLHKLFFPSSLAVMGIDEDSDSLGRCILTNIAAGNFNGSIYPISETTAKVDGLATHADLAAVGRPVDLAVLALPLEQVPCAIDVCGQAGVSGVVILARNGSAEKTVPAILQRARETGVRVIGPRSWGVVSPWTGLNAGLGQQMPLAGELAVISQSAAVCASILDLSVTKQIGLSLLAGLGDMLEVDCADLMDYTANHFRVKAILLHVEHISDMRKCMSAARAASRVKPVVVLKTGRSPSAAAATTTDSASLFGEDAVYDAAFKRAGIVRVATVEDLFDCGDLLSKQPRPRGPNLAIITHARCPGIMAVDALQDHGLRPAQFDGETVAAVDPLLGSAWDRCNPVIVRADVPPDHYGKLVGDPWQGQGVGAQLLSRLAAIAVQRGFKTLWGLVLRENRAMLELARTLGWPLRSGEDASEVEVHLDLTSLRVPEIQAAVGRPF